LAEILLRADASVPSGAKSLKIDGLACDSRKVAADYLFFALLGANEDGNRYVRGRHRARAIAIASEAAPPVDLPANVVWIQVAESRKSLAVAAANFFGRPAEALQLIAVTGTNGKTTTSSLIDSVLRASEQKPVCLARLHITRRSASTSRPTQPQSRWTCRGFSPKFATLAGNTPCWRPVRTHL